MTLLYAALFTTLTPVLIGQCYSHSNRPLRCIALCVLCHTKLVRDVF